MGNQYRIEVYGRVQGVGFRYAAQKQARSLHLKGWVRNRPDGSVELLVNGRSMACTSFIAWCRKGSGYSWVERVDIHEMKAEPQGPFRISY